MSTRTRTKEATIARRIRHFRRLAGLSGAALARAVGVSPPAVTQWERGTHQPTHENLRRVADACGVEMRTFFDRLGRTAEPKAS